MADNQTGPVGPRVDVTNALFDQFVDDWKRMRDTFAGETRVKEEGEDYLPRPSGMGVTGTATEAQNQMYKAYKDRAQFPDLVAPTVRGMMGVMTGTPPKFDIPTTMEYLNERATQDNVTLHGAFERTLQEVLQMGRYGLLVDLDAGGQPQLVCYTAECIRNWVIETINGKDVLTHLILDESRQEFDKANFSWQEVKRFRVLELNDQGQYQTTLWRSDMGGFVIEPRDGLEGDKATQPAVPTMKGGKPLDFIPFVFIDSTDLTPDPDEIPLIGLARVSLALYRKSADYEQALYMSGQETLFIWGISQEDAPSLVGSTVICSFRDSEGHAEYVGPSGAGLSAQRTAIQDDRAVAVSIGTKVLNTEGKAQESGDALRMRFASQTATLKSINNSVAAGFERALRYAAMWQSGSAEADSSIVVTPNNEFVENKLSGMDLTALVTAWQSQAISKQTLFENLQRGEIIRHDKDFDEEQAEIEEDPVHQMNAAMQEAALTGLNNANDPTADNPDNPDGGEEGDSAKP